MNEELKAQLTELLKNNLKIEVWDSSCSSDSIDIQVGLLFDGDVISDSQVSVSLDRDDY